ncbi:hypothetical protein BCR41DRAFT_392810 [Lobosporangium transversale]|uniref:Uncharacterized protein n=1 Tax=Lobosporangium transversale TaxID=64571 RepID=A0A1Y2H0A4_9FUNG|nr:hypothetical protein BCR41DRAFT_392810 [Lobosporangium transversale]ORZ27474.1 hypothetical protein BCR41DRAFT_392810 [Lobosporangium transversale]|eukprot:XP_021885201.1 hypothetical protein BCR41DRAFT_392810 [Lobosporangium transversale]
MFGNKHASPQNFLFPTKALKLFNIYMECIRIVTVDDDIIMELRIDADTTLSRIQRNEKRWFTLSAPIDLESLRQRIALAYHELACLHECLDHAGDAKKIGIKAEKWTSIQGSIIRDEPSTLDATAGKKREEKGTSSNNFKTEAIVAKAVSGSSSQLGSYAPAGYLGPDDLANTLAALSSHLQSAHAHSDDHLYHLAAGASHVLDVMVNNQVKVLRQEQPNGPT